MLFQSGWIAGSSPAMTVNMTWTTWALFALTEGALCLVPGPAVLLVVAQGLARGGRASIWVNLGILTGNTIYFALSATGLGAVLLASYDVFFAIKWLGAAYLVWLGISAFFGRASTLSVTAARERSRPLKMLTHGVVLQLANPKAILFFTAFLPQFIDPAEPLLPQFLILAVTSVVIEFFVLLAYGALAGRAAVAATRPELTRWINRVSGSLLVAAGIGMAALRKN
jgi:homoserine/homoserine lactone efflux protein